MQGGDLDNGMIQRILFLWEHTLGSLPEKEERREAKALKRGRWEDAVDCWNINEFAVHRIADLWTRYDFRVDVVVTTRPQEFADHLAVRLDWEDVLINHVTSTEVQVLARKLAHMPDVARVVFADPALQFAFGRKGRYMAADGSIDFILN